MKAKLKGFTIIETLTSFSLLIIFFTLLLSAYTNIWSNPDGERIKALYKFKQFYAASEHCYWPLGEAIQIDDLMVTKLIKQEGSEGLLFEYLIHSKNKKELIRLIKYEKCN